MSNSRSRSADSALWAVRGAAALFFIAWTWVSFARWDNFQYRTFDLAYYVQTVWQLIHGRFHTTVLAVPFLGNHAEPILALITPLFALLPHPMIFVVVQNAALAAMGPIAFQIAKRIGLTNSASAAAAIALLLAPAAGYVALHEFHPEALAAPLLLSMLRARLERKLAWHWFWFVAVLACKENLALLLASYCAVHLFLERKNSAAELCAWFVWPLLVAVSWFMLYTKIVAPALNSGAIDYLALYNRLGASSSDILHNLFRPQLFSRALADSLSHGNLFWILLLCSLGASLLRPRWFVISAPILLQHLLSWRSSEWDIYFHYAAPILPLFWIAAVELIARLNQSASSLRQFSRFLPAALLLVALAAQIIFGPARALIETTGDWFSQTNARAHKYALLDNIPPAASVVAPLPYLAHLATREKIYSLHHVLKGLNTLSHETYTPPPPTDFVVIDYGDTATFDSAAGYYHPTMQTADGKIIPSSDRLLHLFLRTASWNAIEPNELTLLQRRDSLVSPTPVADSIAQPLLTIGMHTFLLRMDKIDNRLSASHPLRIELEWNFQGEREIFPWMILRAQRDDKSKTIFLTKGLCAPEIAAGNFIEQWQITAAPDLSAGDYTLQALFFDNTKRSWPNESASLLASPIDLGRIKVEP